MSEMVKQNDGLYALCFKNRKHISEEEVKSIFKKYGIVESIRHSSDAVPWVFIRYKIKEEAQSAFDDLLGYKDFEIQVARSVTKKKQEQDGDHLRGDNTADRSRGTNSVKDNRTQNSYAEKYHRSKEESIHRNDQMNDREGARAPSPSRKVASRDFRTHNERYYGGKKENPSEKEYGESSKVRDDSLPRLVKNSPGNRGLNGSLENESDSDDGPPPLVKGREFYRNLSNIENSPTQLLALRAACDEVWRNHPIHLRRILKEVIIIDFVRSPSRKFIYELCSPVKPLHVGFGETKAKRIFSRVLVETELEVKHLLSLNSDEITVTTLEELIDISIQEEYDE